MAYAVSLPEFAPPSTPPPPVTEEEGPLLFAGWVLPLDIPSHLLKAWITWFPLL